MSLISNNAQISMARTRDSIEDHHLWQLEEFGTWIKDKSPEFNVMVYFEMAKERRYATQLEF